MIRVAFYLCGLPPQNTWPQSNHEENTTQMQTQWHSTWPLLLKSVKVIENKESLRNCHSLEELKEIWWLNVMWYPEGDPGTEKGHEVKSKETQIKHEL